MQTGLYCSKKLETTFNQVGKKSLHIIFNISLIWHHTIWATRSLSFIPFLIPSSPSRLPNSVPTPVYSS